MKPIYSGKVREIYDISKECLVIVTTDRISAFDSILPMPIQNKGILLNKLSNFWFTKTRHIVPNHILDERVENMPSFFQDDYYKERTVMVQKLRMLPFEFVVRGYLFGSMWQAYAKGESFCAVTLPAHYRLAQKLEHPVLTPARKYDNGHDEYISFQDMASDLGIGLANQITDICLRLYETCSQYALSKRLIIADAKFEFGLDGQGNLVLGDEIFTPDASRFWDAAHYKAGTEPDSFDKQFLRNWLLQNKINGEFQFERVPQDILLQTARLYQECYQRLVMPMYAPKEEINSVDALFDKLEAD